MDKITTRSKAFLHVVLSTILIGFLVYGLQSCSSEMDIPKGDTISGKDETERIKEYETKFTEDFYQNIQTDESTIKLMGHKTFNVNEEEVAELKALLEGSKESLDSLGFNYYSEDGKTFRVYFPMAGALVDVSGKTYEADENGLIKLSNTVGVRHISDVSVIGRVKSDIIRGTGSNIDQGDRLLLKTSLRSKANRPGEDSYVFDLGEQEFASHGDDHEDDSTKSGGKSCFDNHGGRNCSTAFNIRKGRCTFTANRCMDFNGKFTNCKKSGFRKAINYIGSDCNIAMSRGSCWNEIM